MPSITSCTPESSSTAAINIGERPVVAGDLANYEGAHTAEAGEIEAPRFFEHEIGDPVGKAAPKVPPNRVPLIVVAGINHLFPAALSKREQSRDLLRRV